MDMKSILTTLDLINQPKPTDVIAEDEVEEELTLEELEALEEDDELEEATMDDWYKAGGWKRISRSQEKTPHGTLRKSTYVQDEEVLVYEYDENGEVTVFKMPESEVDEWINENPESRGLAESVEVEEGLVDLDPDGNPVPVKSVTTPPKRGSKQKKQPQHWSEAPKTPLEPRIPKMEEVDETSDQQLDEAFSRKHYELFASMLQEITDLNARMDFADRLVTLFRQDNPRFNEELFLKAAGLAD